MEKYINRNSEFTTAVNLYQGLFYKAVGNNWNSILDMIQIGKLRIFVISAGYGVVDIRESIQTYDVNMVGHDAKIWHQHDLGKIIGFLLVSLKPKRAFGYFTGLPDWKGTRYKYLYFFTNGIHIAIENEIHFECAGCFHGYKGDAFTLTHLGKTMVQHSNSGFNCQFASNIKTNPVFHGTETISYHKII